MTYFIILNYSATFLQKEAQEELLQKHIFAVLEEILPGDEVSGLWLLH